MNPFRHTPPPTPLSRSLARHYFIALAAYFGLMLTLWALGVEGIYAHPTPFYALWRPIFNTPSLPLAAACAAAWFLSRQSTVPRQWLKLATQVLFASLAAIFAVQWFYELLLFLQVDTDLAQKHVAPLLWSLPPLAVVCFAAFALYRFTARAATAPDDSLDAIIRSPRKMRRFLIGAYLFALAFALTTAMLRGGPQGITDAYSRNAYEYIGDIGKTSGIVAFWTRYNELHPYLSMHSKVHPPGPVTLLWLFSWFVGNSPLALSIMTAAFGALAVVPLYSWARECVGDRPALLAVLLYPLIPAIVLFTSTSADILFMPFTLTTLFCFDRAVRRGSAAWALAAGLGYAAMTLLSFSLIGIGAWFALIAHWQLLTRRAFFRIVQTAAIMTASLLAVHALVWRGTGFNVIECFRLAHDQFWLDQHHLDQITPRLPFWTYKLLNPLCWVYFAGIPLSILGWRALRAKGSPDLRTFAFLAAVMLLLLDFLYLARGEGERSALYVFPFFLLPAAAMLDRMTRDARNLAPLWTTLAFLAFQSLLTEAFFYTYW